MKRKRWTQIAAFFLFLFLFVGFFQEITVQAAEEKEEFEIKEGVLLRYNGTKKKVKVPAGVTKIGSGAFTGCYNLKEILLPETLTVIEAYTFDGCVSLESILVPSSVKEIKEGAFLGCRNLTRITIPDSVKTIRERVFLDCDKLTIYARSGCAAHKYAEQNQIPFTAQ